MPVIQGQIGMKKPDISTQGVELQRNWVPLAHGAGGGSTPTEDIDDLDHDYDYGSDEDDDVESDLDDELPST